MTPTLDTYCPRCGAATGKPCTRRSYTLGDPNPVVILPDPHPERTPFTAPVEAIVADLRLRFARLQREGCTPEQAVEDVWKEAERQLRRV